MKQNRIVNWYSALWIVALLAVGYLYFTWHIDKKYIGIVDRKTHLIGSQEAGRIHTLLVQVGDHVQPGQVLAVLDISDLKTQLAHLRSELARIEDLADVQRNQYLAELQRQKLQLDNEALELLDRISLIESKSIELESINALISRLQNAEEAGLGYNPDLAELIIQRDALQAYLQQQSQIDEASIPKLNALQGEPADFLTTDQLDSISHSMLTERFEHAEEIRRAIALNEHRIHLRTLRSPCEGYIIEIMEGKGDIVQEFVPVMTMEESRPRNLTVYIPEKSVVQPEPGTTAKIYSTRRHNDHSIGRVSFLHPGFTLADERLSFRGRIFWARKVDVELPENHALIPGEMVYVRFPNGARNGPAHSAGISPDKTQSLSEPMREMRIPATLQTRSRLEPSGICWVPERRKYLIVSDDTGLKNTPNEHAPYLFWMDGNGNVDAQPLVIRNIDSVNDLEAITAVRKNIFYLLSSQNISKRGKRSANREQLLKIRVTDSGAEMVAKVNLLSRLETDYSPNQRIALGLSQRESDGRPRLNIEGISYANGSLYIGLKEPLSDRGALIWQFSDPEQLFRTGHLQPDQLRLWAEIPLRADCGLPGGISDMAIDRHGQLWILSTIPDTTPEKQMGALYRIRNFPDIPADIRKMRSFPGIKPEGLCFPEENRMLIVVDNDEKTPQFLYFYPETS